MLLFVIRIPILEIYDLSPQTKEMANTFLVILSVVVVECLTRCRQITELSAAAGTRLLLSGWI